MKPEVQVDRPTSSLFDRLIGCDVETLTPTKATRRGRAKQMAVLRSQIERDLLILLGTRRMSADTDLSAWPRVAQSVLNFGVPDLTGMTSSSVDVRRLQRDLVGAVKCYEPRLHASTLVVTCQVGSHPENDVHVSIEASFGPLDALESFAMGVSICLGSGQCRRDVRRQAAYS